jgi:transposase-like protein
MKRCPYCEETIRQNRAGKTKAGSQRYRCMHFGHKYRPEPKAQGYLESVHKRAMEMYVDGNNLRRNACHLKVAPQTVVYWVTDLAEALSNQPLPHEVKEAEMDDMFTFIGDKKTKSTLSRW